MAPVAEGQIAGDQQAAAFVAVGEDLEQQLCSGTAEGEVAEFIANQQVSAIQLIQEAIELIVLLLLFKLIHQRGRREETDFMAMAGCRVPQRDRQMCLARSRLAQQTDIGPLFDPFAPRQFQNLLLVHRQGD